MGATKGSGSNLPTNVPTKNPDSSFSREKEESKLVFDPKFFLHNVPLKDLPTPTNQYDKNTNITYSIRLNGGGALIESFVKAALDDQKENNINWGQLLRAWISMMVGYLDITNDILDTCEDQPAVEWFSVQFCRGHEATYGPCDRRISKTLGFREGNAS